MATEPITIEVDEAAARVFYRASGLLLEFYGPATLFDRPEHELAKTLRFGVGGIPIEGTIQFDQRRLELLLADERDALLKPLVEPALPLRFGVEGGPPGGDELPEPLDRTR